MHVAAHTAVSQLLFLRRVSGVTLPVYLTAHEATGHSRIVLIALIAEALSLTCDAGIERTSTYVT